MEQNTRSQYTLSQDEVREAIFDFYCKKFNQMGVSTITFKSTDVVIEEVPEVCLVINSKREL